MLGKGWTGGGSVSLLLDDGTVRSYREMIIKMTEFGIAFCTMTPRIQLRVAAISVSWRLPRARSAPTSSGRLAPMPPSLRDRRALPIYHALALLAVASVTARAPSAVGSAAGWLFVAGTVVFSGSLYAWR